MVARHETPSVKFLMDLEGPSDRYQTSSDSGGHVPVPVDSESFWVEREAGRFMKNVPGAYLRIQTATDYTGRIPDNHHAIALIDSATSTEYGGSGIAAWTRVNDSVMNPEDHIYSVSNPPLWIPEAEERNRICREILYLHELAGSDFTGVASNSPLIVPRSSFSVSPNPCHNHATVRFSGSSLIAHRSSLSVFDASGRLVHSSLGIRASSLRLDLRSMPAGVYLLRLNADGRFATARLVVN
jgi:hypothetical protein